MIRNFLCTGGENVSAEYFENQETANGTQGGAVLFAPPSKSCRFSHPPSPCARSMAQGISLSADSDLEGTCPLRTPRQLRSAGAALLFFVFYVHRTGHMCPSEPQKTPTSKKTLGGNYGNRFEAGHRTAGGLTGKVHRGTGRGAEDQKVGSCQQTVGSNGDLQRRGAAAGGVPVHPPRTQSVHSCSCT